MWKLETCLRFQECFLTAESTCNSEEESIRQRLLYYHWCLRGWDMGGEESAREEVWCGGNEDAEMAVWSHKARQDTKCQSSVDDDSGRKVRKVPEKRLKWFWHVMDREEEHVGRRVMQMRARGTRKRGGPKLRWMDKISEYMHRGKGITGDRCINGRIGPT